MVMMGMPNFTLFIVFMSMDGFHAHNHHNEVTFSSCSWMNYCERERERERETMGRAFYRFCQGNSKPLAKSLGWVGGWVRGWVGGEWRSWQNLLGGNASPFARIQRMKLKCCDHLSDGRIGG
jgi:hypothetical protein